MKCEMYPSFSASGIFLPINFGLGKKTPTELLPDFFGDSALLKLGVFPVERSNSSAKSLVVSVNVISP